MRICSFVQFFICSFDIVINYMTRCLQILPTLHKLAPLSESVPAQAFGVGIVSSWGRSCVLSPCGRMGVLVFLTVCGYLPSWYVGNLSWDLCAASLACLPATLYLSQCCSAHSILLPDAVFSSYCCPTAWLDPFHH